jgi:hypothetical protein
VALFALCPEHPAAFATPALDLGFAVARDWNGLSQYSIGHQRSEQNKNHRCQSDFHRFRLHSEMAQQPLAPMRAEKSYPNDRVMQGHARFVVALGRFTSIDKYLVADRLTGNNLSRSATTVAE